MGAGNRRGVESGRPPGRDTNPCVTELSDVALVVAISRRNRYALAELYDRHGAKIYGLARRLCGDDRSKEVVERVFLEMWEEPHRYNPDRGSLSTFLLTRAHGCCVDRLRADGLRPAGETACAVAGSVDDEAGGPLGALPDGQREAIVLTYLKGYTYRDAADVLGEPEGTIKSRIRSGLASLSIVLREERVPLTSGGEAGH